jgi:hypothetical protein
MAQLKEIAEAPMSHVLVDGFPTRWGMLLWYLGADMSTQHPSLQHVRPTELRRHQVEAECANAPILVDALWRADMRWTGERRHGFEAEFPIATYSGFWRPEILLFMNRVEREHVMTHERCVLVPCSADKPYPSRLHQAVREAVGPDYEMIATSSAVGVAPESFWHLMPHYDAGLPYFDRAFDTSHRFFSHAGRRYKRIINYTDMLQWDIREGFNSTINDDVMYEPVWFPRRCDYQDLMAPENLEKLRLTVAKPAPSVVP